MSQSGSRWIFSLFILFILGLHSTLAFECPDDDEGQYTNYESCSSFYRCQEGVATEHDCPNGLFFDQEAGVCTFPEESDCLAEAMQSDRGILKDEAFSSDFCTARANGDYKNPQNCSTFFTCSNGDVTLRECPDDLHFHDEIRTCDWPRRAQCTEEPAPSTDEPTTPSPDGESGPPTKDDPFVEEPAPADSTCSVCGLFGNPQDCTRYALCAGSHWRELKCPLETRFDTITLECTSREDCKCASTTLMEISHLFT